VSDLRNCKLCGNPLPEDKSYLRLMGHCTCTTAMNVWNLKSSAKFGSELSSMKGAMMTDLASEIADCYRSVMGCQPCKRRELIHEIQKMARVNNAWPTASYAAWDAAIDEAVKRGLLACASQTIWLSVQPKEKPTQGELF
jgi:hypothetical protein